MKGRRFSVEISTDHAITVCGKGARRYKRFPHPLERCRPRHPHPEASQSGVREAAMNTALRVIRPRTPIDVSDKSWRRAPPRLERELSEPSFKIADFGKCFPPHTQRSEKSSRNDNSPAFIKRSPAKHQRSVEGRRSRLGFQNYLYTMLLTISLASRSTFRSSGSPFIGSEFGVVVSYVKA